MLSTHHLTLQGVGSKGLGRVWSGLGGVWVGFRWGLARVEAGLRVSGDGFEIPRLMTQCRPSRYD